MATLGHLARRFFGSLGSGGPAPSDETWAEEQFLPGELAIWKDMSGPDRRHSVGVARCVQMLLGDEATRPVLAAALLHDCGKVQSGLGTFGRVGATVLSATVMRTSGDAERWSHSDRAWKRAVGVYRQHPQRGADMLRIAGSDQLTIAWTREHHLPRERWTVRSDLADALSEADDD